jgi:hypothetical protein
MVNGHRVPAIKEYCGFVSCAGLGPWVQANEHMGIPAAAKHVLQCTDLALCKPLVQPATQAVICRQKHDGKPYVASLKQLQQLAGRCVIEVSPFQRRAKEPNRGDKLQLQQLTPCGLQPATSGIEPAALARSDCRIASQVPIASRISPWRELVLVELLPTFSDQSAWPSCHKRAL